MNTAQLPTLDDSVNRLKNAAKREIRKTHPNLIIIPDRALYAKMFAGMVNNGGDANTYVTMIDAFLAVYVQNQKKGGVSTEDALDILAERLRLIVHEAEEMERVQIIQARPLS